MEDYMDYGFDHDVLLYFEWLVAEFRGLYYRKLLWKLFTLGFVGLENGPDDSSRVVEGLDLRKTFVDTHSGVVKSCGRTDGVSFLEVLMALAVKIDDKVMWEERYGDRHLDWFWIFIDNIGLSRATDGVWNRDWELFCEQKVEQIVYREYDSDGEGGIFQVDRRPDDADMRSVDLWRQAMWWLSENIRLGVID